MSWTLYRYILLDLIRLLVIATAVLVTLISAAAAIKPLSEGELGPTLVIRFIIYIMPTMLQFTLPFAAAFASTLVFVRMTSDNEILACSASGMSYRTILLPVIFLGLALLLTQFFLSNFVAPSFYKRAEQLIQDDITALVVSRVKERETVKVGKMMLYADRANEVEAPVNPQWEIQPSRRILLEGVAVGRIDESGTLRGESTAEFADVLLFRDAGDSWVTMRLENVMVFDETRGDLFFAVNYALPAVRLPNPLSDKPDFMSWRELRRLGRNPERFDRIQNLKNTLAAALASELVLRRIHRSLQGADPSADPSEDPSADRSARGAANDPNRDGTAAGDPQPKPSDGGVTLTLPSLAGARYTFRVPVVHRSAEGVFLEGSPQKPVSVQVRSDGRLTRSILATRGRIQLEVTEATPEPRVVVTLSEVRMRDLREGGQVGERETLELPLMRWPTPVLGELRERTADQLRHRAAQAPFRHVPEIARAAGQLQLNIQLLARRVLAQLHERAASAIGAMLTLLFGAVLAMKMRGSMPLVVYFWAFLLAILTVIVTRSGENVLITHSATWVGLAVTWAGAWILAGALLLTLVRLRRH